MLRKFILPGAIVLAGITVVLILIIAKPKPEASPAAAEPAHVKVAVTTAMPRTVQLAVNAHGTVAPKREIDLVAQVSGQIVSVEPAFADGGFFSRSEALIQIDDRDYQVALLNSKARLAEAERLLAEEEGRSLQAKREWRDLGNQTANDLFLRKPQLAAARAQVASARADVEMAELNLERTRIRVPFDGRVKEIFADLGQFVSVGTRLATVYDSTVVEVRVPLTEKQAVLLDLPLTHLPLAGRAALDSSLDSSLDSPAALDGKLETRRFPEVTITGSVAGRKSQWLGRLTRTDAFVDAGTRMFYAVVEVANPFAEVPLLPGLFVEAEIAGRQIENVTVLPREALFQLDKILTLDSENKVVHHTVDVLRKSDTQVWIKADLARNTLVSTEKQSLTPAGSIVEPLELSDINPSEVATLDSVTPANVSANSTRVNNSSVNNSIQARE